MVGQLKLFGANIVMGFRLLAPAHRWDILCSSTKRVMVEHINVLVFIFFDFITAMPD